MPEDFKQMSSNLKEAYKRFTRLWWNVNSLEHYIGQGQAPRGLRVQIFPAWEVTQDFKLKWEEGLTQCSQIMMRLLIEHDKALLESTKGEIDDLRKSLGDLNQPTLTDPFLLNLKKDIDAFEDTIVEQKKRKVVRDQGDYDSGRAYRWRHRGNPRNQRMQARKQRPRSRNSSRPRQSSTSQSDFLSSGSEMDNANDPGRPFNYPQWQRGPGMNTRSYNKRARLEMEHPNPKH